MRCGVLFIATGVAFLKEAEFAAAPSYSFIDKILPLARSLFESTLFLDTDTCVLTRVEEVFEGIEKV